MEHRVTERKFLLLGGEGFIGRNIAEYFSEGNTCLSVGSEKSLFENRKDRFLAADPYLEKIQHTSDIIIHLIDHKIASDSFVEQEKKLVENINLNATHHLVLFSSAVLYANPDSEYGQRKQLLEKFYTQYCEEQSITLTILRLFNTYGPYQIPYRQGSLVANLIFNALNGIKTDINDREAARDFLYAGDIPKCLEYAILNNVVGVHDIGSGRLLSIQELVLLLEETVFKRKLDIAYLDMKETTPSHAARGRLGEKIDVRGITEGLQSTLQFYKENMSRMKTYVK